MNATTTEPIEVGSLRIDPHGYRAVIGERSLPLTRAELELLAALVQNRHRVLSRAELQARVGVAHARSVDVLLCRLRRILGSGFVRNIRNRGWILVPEALA